VVNYYYAKYIKILFLLYITAGRGEDGGRGGLKRIWMEDMSGDAWIEGMILEDAVSTLEPLGPPFVQGY
jgi:hypothetical protein